ncbi:response regulator [Dasania marina]|uniref:response regulator n=1 Tax=Dasania marina TaxID=471499 RepID=UPI00037C8338|nr:response regulator [Dasania marina]|tara:strand:+ start:163606 stop:163977 length:372 start_codon:yes stop_codon:yes gene_type:complete
MDTILLVEDNEMNRDMLSRRLQRKGYKVVSAINGEDAVTIAKQLKPHLILMDMELPIKDGWTASKEIKQLLPSIPIIALTAHAFEGDKEKALAAGCNDYATKPVDFNALLGLLSRYHDKNYQI